MGLSESEGVLWILSNVPVPDAYERAKKAHEESAPKAAGRGWSESDARLSPFEELSTGRLEAYDAATGRFLADVAIKAYPVAIFEGGKLMIYTPSANDTAQLEIWELKLRR